MEVLNREKLNRLAQKSNQFLISLYMPTHRVGREMQQDPILFKNLISQVEKRLFKLGLRKPEIETMLKPAHTLALNPDFWQHQSDGLALFIEEKFSEFYRLPINFEELLVISERFHIKPLLPLLSRNGYFYVLALSQKQVRLLQGTLFSIDELDLDDVPTSLREALWFDDPEKQLQFHTSTNAPGSSSARPAVFHGQGVNEDGAKTDLLRYFQKVDKGLMEMLADEQAPMVLAGVDYLLPIYQQVNKYPHLIKTALVGNPDELHARDLQQQAWEIVEPVFSADQRQALARYQELSGSDSRLASSDPKSIIPAAHYGRVDTLFVALGAQMWGKFNAMKNILVQHQRFQPGDQDLLDLAAVQTLTSGGTVYALDIEDMPDKTQIAAIFRYAYDQLQHNKR